MGLEAVKDKDLRDHFENLLLAHRFQDAIVRSLPKGNIIDQVDRATIPKLIDAKRAHLVIKGTFRVCNRAIFA